MIRSKRANLRRGAGTGVPADRRNRRAATRARVSGAEPVRGSARRAAGETLAAASDEPPAPPRCAERAGSVGRAVRRHLPALVSYAWYLLHDRSEAEDVVQDAFLRLLAKGADVAAGWCQSPHLAPRVVTNLCIDRKRRLVRLIYLPACLLDGGSAGPALEDEIGRRMRSPTRSGDCRGANAPLSCWFTIRDSPIPKPPRSWEPQPNRSRLARSRAADACVNCWRRTFKISWRHRHERDARHSRRVPRPPWCRQRRWPDGQRPALRRLLKESCHAQAMVEAARKIERALDTLQAPPGPRRV